MKRKLTFYAKRIEPNFAYTGRVYVLDVSINGNIVFWIGFYFWEVRIGFETIN